MVRMGETGFMGWTEHKSLSITNKYIKFDNTIRIFITIDVFELKNALIGVCVWIYFMP
ncbi:hypothetical protein HMPREF0012_00350 [Acinetobacter calcoaceticus RUH2202]|nr:hypothetical protein HMPREF0012_00350 [Acinetobacter calcoaceticus RUH2202]